MSLTIKKYMKHATWNRTPITDKGVFALRQQVAKVCGDATYGKGHGKIKEGVQSLVDNVQEVSTDEHYLELSAGTHVKLAPTEEECVEKVRDLKASALKYYSMNPKILVTDHWYKDAKVKEGAALNANVPLQKRVLQRAHPVKRFTGVNYPAAKHADDMVKECNGWLAEGFVVAFLNSGFRCPECKVAGAIGTVDAITHTSVDAFRDAVCLSCRSRGVLTLFEIKTRWESRATSNRIYAGSFVAINSMLAAKVNVYMVVASRDTGTVRYGKITKAELRENKNWLYAVQEGLDRGAPSCYVTCGAGLKVCPIKMTPLKETLTNSVMARIVEKGLID